MGSIVAVTDIGGRIVAEQNFDAWGRNRNPANWEYAGVPAVPAWLYRGFTGHEHLPQFALINMIGRMYDPIQGRMLSPDNYVPTPYGSQGYNRYAYAMNNPLVITDPDGEFIVPILVGAFVGGFLGGIQADLQGESFLGGFWKGAIVGGIGGGLSLIGGGSLLGNAAWGAGQGVFTNGVSNLLNGDSFFQGAGTAALLGAAFAIVTSDNTRNLFKGHGFRSNDEVLGRFIKNNDYTGALEYFKMEADLVESFPNKSDAAYNPKTQRIEIAKSAFKLDNKASFDALNYTYQKELWHQKRFLAFRDFYDVGDNINVRYHAPHAAEDAMGHAYMQKNAGAFPGVFRSSPLTARKGWEQYIGQSSDFARQYIKPWPLQYVDRFIYTIPRRFRNLLPYVPVTR